MACRRADPRCRRPLMRLLTILPPGQPPLEQLPSRPAACWALVPRPCQTADHPTCHSPQRGRCSPGNVAAQPATSARRRKNIISYVSYVSRAHGKPKPVAQGSHCGCNCSSKAWMPLEVWLLLRMSRAVTNSQGSKGSDQAPQGRKDVPMTSVSAWKIAAWHTHRVGSQTGRSESRVGRDIKRLCDQSLVWL